MLSGMSDRSLLILSSVQSNQTNYDRQTIDEDSPASAIVGETNATLRVRYNAIIRRQRFERKVQRYDEEVTRLATQMQSNSLNAIKRHVNAAVGELNSVLNNPPSGAVLVPSGPNRTESWLDTQNTLSKLWSVQPTPFPPVLGIMIQLTGPIDPEPLTIKEINPLTPQLLMTKLTKLDASVILAISPLRR